MKTIKIIDLLNKIANSEEMPRPKEIKDFTFYLYTELGETCDIHDLRKTLNQDIEIIEEDKKIEEIGSWYEILEQESKKTQLEEINHNFYKIFDRLEQLIDEVNKLKEDK